MDDFEKAQTPIHTANLIYTFSEVWQATMSATGVRGQSMRIKILCLASWIMTIAALFISAQRGDNVMFFLMLMYLVFWLVFAVVILFSYITVKWEWRTNKFMQNAQITFNFYPDRMEFLSEYDNLKSPYDWLYRVLETNTHFHFFIAASKMYPLPKKVTTQVLQEFVRQKAKEYKIYKKKGKFKKV